MAGVQQDEFCCGTERVCIKKSDLEDWSKADALLIYRFGLEFGTTSDRVKELLRLLDAALYGKRLDAHSIKYNNKLYYVPTNPETFWEPTGSRFPESGGQPIKVGNRGEEKMHNEMKEIRTLLGRTATARIETADDKDMIKIVEGKAYADHRAEDTFSVFLILQDHLGKPIGRVRAEIVERLIEEKAEPNPFTNLEGITAKSKQFVLQFLNPVWELGKVNMTITRGIEWAEKLTAGDKLLLNGKGVSANQFGQNTESSVVRTTVVHFNNLPADTIFQYHDPAGRTREGLLALMRKQWPDFKSNEIVTVIAFVPYEKK
jgi:hypothetical protein